MHQLVASYLFQKKICPLPGFGSLSLNTVAAGSDFINHQIKSPGYFIHFDDHPVNDPDFLDFVAFKTGCTHDEASEALEHFCDQLRSSIAGSKAAELEGVGNFLVDNNGNIIFEQAAIPAVYSKPVFAERVVHPQTAHSMIVGDKETTSKQMSEYLNETAETKDRWWIWAVVLGAVAVTALLVYISIAGSSSRFGNMVSIKYL